MLSMILKKTKVAKKDADSEKSEQQKGEKLHKASNEDLKTIRSNKVHKDKKDSKKKKSEENHIKNGENDPEEPEDIGTQSKKPKKSSKDSDNKKSKHTKTSKDEKDTKEDNEDEDTIAQKKSKSRKKHREKAPVSSDNDSSDNFDADPSVIPPKANTTFLDLSIKPLERLELTGDLQYVSWVTNGNTFTRAVEAASIAFLEAIRLYSGRCLCDLVRQESARFGCLREAKLPEELLESLRVLDNVEAAEAAFREEKIKDSIGDFLLRCLGTFPGVQDHWRSGAEAASSAEWDAVAQIASNDVEVYTRELNEEGRTELRKVVYRCRSILQFAIPLCFVVEEECVGILYTAEQAARAGYESVNESQSFYSMGKKQISNKGMDVQTQKYDDYIGILERGLAKLNEGGKAELHSLNLFKQNLNDPKVNRLNDIKEAAKNEIVSLLHSKLKKSLGIGGKAKECGMCRKQFPSNKLITVDCSHSIDLACLRK